MRVVFISVENSLSNIGFRRLASLVRLTRPDLEVGFVVPFRATAPWKRLTAQTYQQKLDDEVDAIASYLAQSDIVCFSSMSIHAEYTKSLIRAVRGKNPAVFVVWGGSTASSTLKTPSGRLTRSALGRVKKPFPSSCAYYLKEKTIGGWGISISRRTAGSYGTRCSRSRRVPKWNPCLFLFTPTVSSCTGTGGGYSADADGLCLS